MPNDSTFPPFYPHDSIEEIISDVFMVRGTIRMNALMRITRNMAIVRHEGEEHRVVGDEAQRGEGGAREERQGQGQSESQSTELGIQQAKGS